MLQASPSTLRGAINPVPATIKAKFGSKENLITVTSALEPENAKFDTLIRLLGLDRGRAIFR